MKKYYLFCCLIAVELFLLPIKLSGAEQQINYVATKKVTLHFNQIPIKELLRWLSELLHMNVILSDAITGTITVHLYNIEWSEAFNALLKMSGLIKQEHQNVTFITTLAEVKQMEQQRNDLVSDHLITTLRFANAEETATLLKTSGLVSAKGQVAANSSKNNLWIVDTPHNLHIIKEYLKMLDRPEKQILIEARIVNMDCEIMHELGFHFKTKSAQELQGLHMSLPDMATGRWNFSIMQFASPNFLDLELTALESQGKVKILACPKLITQNRKSAVIESGEEVPYQEQTASGATSVNFKKAALSLKVTPQLTAQSQIILSLEINQDKVSSLTVNGTPGILMQNLKTQVMIKDGQTVILGGIFEESQKNIEHQLPMVSHIPLIGRLFGDHSSEFSRKELLIFITPKVLEDDVNA